MSHYARTSFCVLKAVEFIAQNFTRSTFCTLTFKENLTVKRDAQERWDPLKKRLRRRYPDLLGVGVWQRQKRGAWHLHVVFSDRLSIEWLRDAALECGFGSFINIKYVDCSDNVKARDFTRAPIVGATDVAKYITRYLRRAKDAKDKGVRVVEYMGACRISTTSFRWVGGMSRLWRAGVAAWVVEWGCEPSFDGWENVIQLGWDSLSLAERKSLLVSSRQIYQWQNPDKFPF